MQFGILGSGSWATALAKILTDNDHSINWWIRNAASINHIKQRHHNPHYLNSAYFNTGLLNLSDKIETVVEHSEVLVIAIPSAFVEQALTDLPADIFAGKKIVSAVKGILPASNLLLNAYLAEKFGVALQDYYTLLGPCHAEEVAAEKLSYLTFSGLDEEVATTIAGYFETEYLNTMVNRDVIGVQYAAVLKNIYAVGAGIAHGLEYGDNFLSVYISNAAREMVTFLRKVVSDDVCGQVNYSSSVYLGDLLVTCYSLYSRNRMFGNMLGKGYSVKAAQLELNMVAEGYNATKCINITNQQVQAPMPIAKAIYDIVWDHLPAARVFKKIETVLV